MMAICTKAGMTHPHPEDFVSIQVVQVLELNVSRSTEALGICWRMLAALLNGQSPLWAETALRIKKAPDVNMNMLVRVKA